MTRGQIILGIVVAALGLLVYYIASISTWKETEIPTPLRGEAAINPFYAAENLVKRLGGQAKWSRELTALPPNNHAMVLSGWHWDVSAPRRREIEQWVEKGGRLVVDQSIIAADQLYDWAGVRRDEFTYSDDEDETPDPADESGGQTEQDDAPSPWDAKPCREYRHAGVTRELDPTRRPWTLCDMAYERRLDVAGELQWGLADEFGLQAVRVKVGAGSVTIVDGTPFMWRELQVEDHGLLLAAALDLRRGDHVLFLSGDREQSLLDLIWRFGWPVVLLTLAAILAWIWRRGARFGPPLPDPIPARRSLGEQIRGTGGFIFRAGGAHALHTAAMQALDRLGEQRLRGYANLPEAERARVLADATALDVERIRSARDWPRTARAADLGTAVACLESARRLLAAYKIR
jgi:hypothetical protein